MDFEIPDGRYAGRRVSQLSAESIERVIKEWENVSYMRENPMFGQLVDELANRRFWKAKIAEGRKAKAERKQFAKSKSAPKLTGMVEAKCFKCGSLSKISANSWAGEGIASKPKCSCGGMIYLADQSLCVTFVGEVHFGKRIR